MIISSAERERDLQCRAHPFHAVSGRNLTKLLVVIEFGDVGGVSQFRVIRRSAEVELPSRFGECVKTAGGWRGSRRRRRRPGWGGRGRRGCL